MTENSTATKKAKARIETKAVLKKSGPLGYQVLDGDAKPMVCKKCGRKLLARLAHVSSPKIKKVCEIPEI